MAFPSSPANGQQAVVNNITYQYVAARHSWVRLAVGTDTLTVNNLVTTSNVSAAAYYWANGAPFASSSYGNTDVANYLPTYTGNISAARYFWANGQPFASSNYGNTDVSNYLPTYSGNLNPGNITASGNIVGGGVRSTTSASAPSGATPGDIWYSTVTETTFRYTNDGTSRFWLDIGGPSLSTNIASLDTVINQSVAISSLNANVTAANAAISSATASVAAANAAIITANSAVVGYVNTLNTVMIGNVDAANSSVVTANTGMKSYVDAVTTAWTANAATQAAAINAISGNTVFSVTNSGASSYLIDGVSNATITLVRGLTYTFNLNATGHPFWIKTAATTGTGDAYNTGVTNNGTAAGVITFVVPLNAPDTLYYICQFHGTMVGLFNITSGLITAKANTASPVFTGTVTAPILSVTGNATISGNILQQQAYYETYGNITNTGGNLTCNFNNGAIFYVTSLTSNVTASFTNVNALSGAATATTLIIEQGATAYRISNIQVNGVNQTIRWLGTTAHSGTASNTDIVSFSLIHLGGGTYRVLGQSSSYG